MAWTTPTTRVTGELITAAIWNTDLKANLDWLFARPLGSVVYLPGGTYDTTSTSFVDVDATNLTITVSAAAARLLAIATFTGDHLTGGDSYYDLILDDTTRAGHTTDGLARIITGEGPAPITIVGHWTGIAAGSRKVELQYRSSNANTARINNRVVNMKVYEL